MSLPQCRVIINSATASRDEKKVRCSITAVSQIPVRAQLIQHLVI